MINGCGVAGLEHDQVVKLIRATRDSNGSTELTLTVKQNRKISFRIIATRVYSGGFYVLSKFFGPELLTDLKNGRKNFVACTVIARGTFNRV